VTHECDYPDEVRTLPHLTRSRIPGAASSALIDVLVSEQAGSLYELDEKLLAELNPDLILTQEQCDVCAVNEAVVRRSAQSLKNRAVVESVNPTTLAGVFAMFRRVGELIEAVQAADRLIGQFEETAAEIKGRQGVRAGAPDAKRRPRILLLEWLDPPYCSGHWNPEIIERAGGTEALGQAGMKSRRVTWNDVAASIPDAIIVSPCGFDLERTALELDALSSRSEWSSLPAVKAGQVTAVDGSAYFSRPGPRLEASLRIAAEVVDSVLRDQMAPFETPGDRVPQSTSLRTERS
jgi:iron complex transport system substrate-binding protein